MTESAPEPTVLFAEHDSVAVITLNRPQALNSFTRQMHRELWAALDRAEDDPAIRAVVFTGAGRGFCAGADLHASELGPGASTALRPDPGVSIDEFFNPTARRLQSLRMPTVVAVNGVAAGAGVSFVLACDIAIAAPGASFIQAFSKIGLVPDAGGTWFLAQRLGLARATAIAMTGDKLPAARAKEWGLIWDVAEDCLDAAMSLAERLAVMPTQALVATRHLLRDSHSRTLNQQLDAERDMQSSMGKTADYVEGVLAFREKRAARFCGR
ncbi:MAG: enoyl-CoA hydratase/isomerase family protein [Candidatus Saccharibacteria bacterium]|nr:enoyl-CoA hydratase/isomerase family protein [Rhodoferax sp.]